MKNYSETLELIGKSFIYYWFVLLSLTTIGFIFGIGITPIYSYFSVIFLYLLLVYLSKSYVLPIKVMLGLFIIISASVFLSLQIWDFSYDGRAYHNVAVHALSEGWNPFTMPDLKSFADYNHGRWVESYPKANWIIIANNLTIMHNIDAAKFVNFALVFSTALILNNFLLTTLKNIFIRLIFILGILINPVVIGQINTLYLDGNLYFLIIIFTVSLVKFQNNKTTENFVFTAILTILLINTKFTSIVFVSISFIMFLLLDYLYTKKLNFNLITKAFVIFFVGFAVFGYSPYINNYKYHGNFLYPVMGKNKVNILKTQINNDFVQFNRFKQLYYSTSSVPSNDMKKFPKLANPLTMAIKIENYQHNNHDTRINGFGPLFIISILLVILGITYSIFIRNKPNKHLYIGITFFIMTISIPTLWWARLVPMLWAVPLFLCIYFYKNKSIFLKFLSITTAIILLINAVLLGLSGSTSLNKRFEETQYLSSILQQLGEQHLYIAFKSPQGKSSKKSITHKLDTYNVNYTVLKENKCNTVGWFYSADVCQTK